MTYPRWPGIIAALLVLCMTLGTVAAVALSARGATLTAADWSAIRFTVVQAALSSVLSVGLAIPVARALARRQFRGRSILISLLGAPFILPVTVAIFGLLGVFGRNSVLSALVGWFGFSPVSIYGFHGVVLAHVFFNMPLATRLILHGWLSIPAERFRLAASLNLSVWRVLEWPMLRAVGPGALVIVFLLCLTSFAVALTLGGGPRATTIELAIYQALRFDFDLGHAAVLASVQFGLCAIVAGLAWMVSGPDGFGSGLDRVIERWDNDAKLQDICVIVLASLFILLPLAVVIWRGVPGLVQLPESVWIAALRSVAVALASVAVLLVLALALALRGGAIAAMAGLLPLATSSLVLGTGLFLLTRAYATPATLALPVTVLVNAIMSLPFALRVLGPAATQAEAGYGRLASTLGLTGWGRLRWLTLPRLRRPLGFSAGLTAALSMGDLGVIALFADERSETLPLAMARLMGAYRMEAAAGAGLLLLVLSFALFWIFDRGGRGDVAA